MKKKRTKLKEKPTILACDPSFTAWGWVVLKGDAIIDSGCIKTAPEAKKRRIREGDDRVRRTEELVTKLLKITTNYNPAMIVTELPHGSQNARAAVMIGIVVGIVQTLSMCENIPVEWYSENDAKKALLGRISASKAEVIKVVQEKLDVHISGPKYYQEAVADALAIYNVARLQSTTLKILMR